MMGAVALLRKEDGAAWVEQVEALERMRVELRGAVDKVCSSAWVEQTRSKMEARLTRRRWRRSWRRRRREEVEAREQRRRRATLTLDAWLQQRQRLSDKAKREEEMQVVADSAVSEVRRKLADCGRLSSILSAICQLRTARCLATTRKGLASPESSSSSSSSFRVHVSLLRSLCRRRAQLYRDEETAILVLTAHDDEEEEEGEEGGDEEAEEEEDEVALFGSTGRQHHAVHQVADSSISALLHIRGEWDTSEPCHTNVECPCLSRGEWDTPEPCHGNVECPCLSRGEWDTSQPCHTNVECPCLSRGEWDTCLSENGSPIPRGWVQPPPPSSPAWLTALL
uniref:Programmed cell death protein 7 n=1 Tax=Petromyzon marinus TaxID=7757 RepID=A0AAJ7XJM9_PETMA|nr:programmed cell death protein 7 [Petromyzon marinus]